MQPHTRRSESDFAVSDRHIWNTITHKKPRAISRDLRLVTDWSRNPQTQFSFRFLVVGGQGEKKKRIECRVWMLLILGLISGIRFW